MEREKEFDWRRFALLRRFEVTQQHITLLKRLNVTWYDDGIGAPGIDSYRPYGNSGVYGDIARALELPEREEGHEGEYTQHELAYMDKLHREMPTALQIVLQAGRMEPGVYKRRDLNYDWEVETGADRDRETARKKRYDTFCQQVKQAFPKITDADLRAWEDLSPYEQERLEALWSLIDAMHPHVSEAQEMHTLREEAHLFLKRG